MYIKLGDVYVNMEKYDDANKYFRQAVASGKKANNKNVVAYALRGLGTSALMWIILLKLRIHLKMLWRSLIRFSISL